MGRGRRFGVRVVVALGWIALVAACASSASSSSSSFSSTVPSARPVANKSAYLVYWDQN
jgi:hypothetical protein